MALKHPHVFWDWDGTLSDSTQSYINAFALTHLHFGLPPLTHEAFLANTGITSVKHFGALLGEAHVDEAITYLYNVLKDSTHLIHLFPEARGWLQAVAAQGGRNIIVSNKQHQALLDEIDRFGLQPLIVAAVGGNEIANHKPHPDHMHEAAKRAGVSVSGADVMVGDSPADYEIAKAAGTFAYLLHSQVHDFAAIIKNNPKACIVERGLLHKTLFQD